MQKKTRSTTLWTLAALISLAITVFLCGDRWMIAYYLASGCLYIMFRLAQWKILAFYRKPLDFNMSTGILSWRLLLVPILMLTLLLLTMRLIRKKEQGNIVSIVLLAFFLCRNTMRYAQESNVHLSFAGIPNSEMTGWPILRNSKI